MLKMIGVSGMASSRRVMKVERPRPLNLSNIGEQSMEVVLSDMDLVAQSLNGGTFDRSTYPQIASLCENLKMFGPQLESVYKDQLDRCYVALRNGCRDDRLSLSSRYRLLEVIELRAMNWQPNENLITYYKQKLAQIEIHEACVEDTSTATDINGYINTAAPIITPTTPVSAPVFPSHFTPYPQTQVNYVSQSQQSSPQVLPSAPLMLGPGEIVKSSGKYTAPVRVPGKNHCKDEIVIRNADSGKVMGLKGRRVHMIEELSETVISFQRVAPGARERLVQITGTTDENINEAKHLIEETIRRNASPVRSEERETLLVTHGGSSSSISSHASDETLQGSKRNVHPGPTLEDNLGEYRYTVTHENDTIRITGNNLDLVRTAKLILDEYFSGERNLNVGIASPYASETDAPHDKGSTEEYSIASDEGTVAEELPKSSSVVTVLRQPLIPSASKEIIESVESGSSQDGNKTIKNRRLLFAKTNEEKSSQGESSRSSASEDNSASSALGYSNETSSMTSRITYSRDLLIKYARSPLCRLPPPNWDQVIRAMPSIAKKEMDSDSPVLLMAEELSWSCLRMGSVTEEDDNGNSSAVSSRTSTEE